MKTLLVILTKAGIFYSCFCYSQNLVLNGSFENYDTCPNTYSQIYRAVPWFQPFLYTSFTTADFFNVCANNSSPANVPNNWVGYQYARTGNGYGGIVIFREINWREYIEDTLNDTLQGGKKYCVELYVNLAEASNWAIKDFGLYLSQDSVLDTTGYYIPYIPQIFNTSNNFLDDTANWQKISGIYIATGGEKFITIGNFKDNANTNAILIGDSSTISDTLAYYYIDDVSVTLCIDTCAPPTAKFNFSSNELITTFNNLTDSTATSWQWYFGDGNTNTAQNPVHVYDSAATYTVTLVACNQTGCCNELCCDTMVGQVSVSVGIDELKSDSYKLQIYPNPTNGEVTISLNNFTSEEFTLVLSDITGRKTKEYSLFKNELKIQTDEFDNGIYFIYLHNNGFPIAAEKLFLAR